MTNALLFGILVMQIIGIYVQYLPRDKEEELKWNERTHESETTNQDILDGKGLKPIKKERRWITIETVLNNDSEETRFKYW